MKNYLFLAMALLLWTSCTTPPKDAALKASQTDATASPPGVITVIPFTVHDNRILVNVMLNGKGPFVMIFDTGGANTITPTVQRQLGIISQGHDLMDEDVVGKRRVKSVHVRTLTLGAYTLSDQKFEVVNLQRIRHAFQFPQLDGVIGFELLQRAKVRVDFDQQRLWVLQPSVPTTMAGARTVKFELKDDRPVIDGRINDQDAKILIDTGDRSNLTLFRKFAKSSQLSELFANREQLVTGVGISGPIPGKIASVQRVSLGGSEVTDILARLPMTRKGYFTREDLSASAGLGLLKGFNLEFDYKNQQLTLQPRVGYAEPSTFTPVNR